MCVFALSSFLLGPKRALVKNLVSVNEKQENVELAIAFYLADLCYIPMFGQECNLLQLTAKNFNDETQGNS